MRDLSNTPYGKFIWFVGIAEDVFSDPTQLGRVRVRAIGFHPDPDKLTKENLPLAPVLNGGSAKINEGQMVLGFFMDGYMLQQPFILGVINGGVESVGGRFFGAIGSIFGGVPSDAADVVTAYKPNPVPGACTINLKGDIKDANGTIDPSTLVRVGTDVKGRPALLKKEAAEAYLAMVAAAKESGVTWVINDSYRDFRRQQTQYNEAPSISARPGKSNHGCGLAVDLGTQIYNRPPYQWLIKNASKFGFKRIYLSGRSDSVEAWHWEYTLRTTKSATDGQSKHTPETLPDGTKNIYDEQVKKKPTVVGDKP
jgi:hypothetical protein